MRIRWNDLFGRHCEPETIVSKIKKNEGISKNSSLKRFNSKSVTYFILAYKNAGRVAERRLTSR